MQLVFYNFSAADINY